MPHYTAESYSGDMDVSGTYTTVERFIRYAMTRADVPPGGYRVWERGAAGEPRSFVCHAYKRVPSHRRRQVDKLDRPSLTTAERVARLRAEVAELTRQADYARDPEFPYSPADAEYGTTHQDVNLGRAGGEMPPAAEPWTPTNRRAVRA